MLSVIEIPNITNINRKTKYLTNFLDSAKTLHNHNASQKVLEEEIYDHNTFVNAIYKDSKLDGYFLIKKDFVNRRDFRPLCKQDKRLKCYILIDKVLPKKLEKDTEIVLSEEIINNLKSDIALYKVDGIVWDGVYYTINRSSLFKAIMWALLIGVGVGIILWKIFKNLGLCLTIGILWALAIGALSFNSEMINQPIKIGDKKRRCE